MARVVKAIDSATEQRTASADAAATAPIESCIERARGGSSDALGQLFEICHDYLVVIARNEMDPDLRAKAGASDIVQETFLDAQRGFGRFRGHTEAELLAWLRQILICHLANLRRHYRDTAKRNIKREWSLPSTGADGTPGLAALASNLATPSWHAVNREEVELVERAILRLPLDYRLVIRLVNQDHRSFVEAGKAMTRTADAARRLWGRAIETLAAELDTDHDRR